MTPEMFTVPHVTQNIPHEGEEFIKSAEGRKRSGAQQILLHTLGQIPVVSTTDV